MALLSAIILRDTLANRPSAGTAGRLFYDTTNSILYRDNGSSWDSVEGAAGMTNPMTTAGDIIKGGASGAPARLAIGSSGDVLTVSGGAPAWAAPASGAAAIVARYKRATAQTINNSSTTIVDYDTSVRDTNSAVTTGASWHFTCPTSQGGDYHVEASLLFDASSAWSIGESGEITIYVNGSAYSALDRKDTQSGTSTFMHLHGSDTVNLSAGDTLDIRVNQISGGSLNTYNNGNYNYVSIFKIH